MAQTDALTRIQDLPDGKKTLIESGLQWDDHGIVGEAVLAHKGNNGTDFFTRLPESYNRNMAVCLFIGAIDRSVL